MNFKTAMTPPVWPIDNLAVKRDDIAMTVAELMTLLSRAAPHAEVNIVDWESGACPISDVRLNQVGNVVLEHK